MTAINVWAKYYSWAKQSYVNEDISDLLKTVSSSNDISTASRKFDITYAYPIIDTTQPRFQSSPGTFITVLLDYEPIYWGLVHTREINTQEQTVTLTAYDCLLYLTKSKVTYNFANIDSEYCVEQICKDLGVRYNHIPTTGVPVTLLLKDQTAFDAIVQIYFEVSKKTGKKYILYSDRNQLSVMEKGAVIQDSISVQDAGMFIGYHALDPKNNVSGTIYKDTLDTMVNRVKAYDSNNKLLGMVKDSESKKIYGTFQQTYSQEEGKDWKTESSKLLHGIDTDITIDGVGDWRFQTGYGAFVTAPYIDTLDKKVLYIEGDVHTWNLESGLYTMELTLNRENAIITPQGA